MPIKILKLKSLLEKWIKDKNASDFYSRVTSYSSPHLHSLVKIAPCPGFQALWFHPFQNHLHFNAVTLYAFFVCFNCQISAKWQSRNTLSSPPLTPCVYRAISTTVLEIVQDQVNVWTWLPRAQVCHNVSGEKDSLSFWMLFSLHYLLYSSNWRVDLVYWNPISILWWQFLLSDTPASQSTMTQKQAELS